MKGLKILFMLFMYHNSFATTYYVSNAGSDVANGTTTGTSWQTISKVNAATFAANDSILFKCGDSWNERLVPNRNTLYFGSYSTGVKPLITGFQTATMIPVSGNVYESTVTPAANLNTVMINDKLSIKARYPNSTYLTFTSGTDSTLVTSLTGTPSYVGKEIAVRTNHFLIDISTVTAQSTGTLSLSPKLTYAVTPNTQGGNGYFFQNDVSYLDSTSEWCYAANNLKVYSTITPTVQYSTIDTLVWVRSKSNIIFKGISFTGANKTAFQLDSCTFITIQNSTLNNNGTNGIVFRRTRNSYVLYDSIMNTLNNPIWTTKNNLPPYVTDTSRSLTITGNYIKNTAIYPGMGLGNNNQYFFNIAADSSLINLNTIDSSAYIGVMWNGKFSTIKNNYITNFGFVKDDGGGIYTVKGASVNAPYYAYSGGSIIRGNIILNGFRADGGINLAASFGGASAGVYLDDFIDSITVDSNTIYNITGYAFNLRTARFITSKHNLFIDSLNNIYNFTGNQVQAGSYTFKNNIYYQKNITFFTSTTGSLTLYIYASDSNYILKPVDTATSWRYNSTNYSLSGYQAATTYEVNSHSMPNYTSSALGRLIYNATNGTATTTLNAPYIDVYGNLYFQDITLPAYGSALLFPSTLYITKYFIPH